MPRRYIPKQRPDKCQRCQAPIAQPARGRRLRCESCTAEWDRERHRKNNAFTPTTCRQCGTTIDGGRFNQRLYCPHCRRTRNRASSAASLRRWIAANPDKYRENHRRSRERKQLGRSLEVRYAACLICHRVLTLHPGQRYCQRPDCKRKQANLWQLEFQRQTRQTAIRYWRIADTPEARDVARLYYQLRQQLRSR